MANDSARDRTHNGLSMRRLLLAALFLAACGFTDAHAKVIELEGTVKAVEQR